MPILDGIWKGSSIISSLSRSSSSLPPPCHSRLSFAGAPYLYEHANLGEKVSGQSFSPNVLSQVNAVLPLFAWSRGWVAGKRMAHTLLLLFYLFVFPEIYGPSGHGTLFVEGKSKVLPQYKLRILKQNSYTGFLIICSSDIWSFWLYFSYMVNGQSDFSTKFFRYMVILAIWSTLSGQNRGPYIRNPVYCARFEGQVFWFLWVSDSTNNKTSSHKGMQT